MTSSAAELAEELGQLQKDFRAYSQREGFSFSEISNPKVGGFVDKYRQRTAEIQNALSRMVLKKR